MIFHERTHAGVKHLSCDMSRGKSYHGSSHLKLHEIILSYLWKISMHVSSISKRMKAYTVVKPFNCHLSKIIFMYPQSTKITLCKTFHLYLNVENHVYSEVNSIVCM